MSPKHMTKQDLRHDSFVETTARATAYLQKNFMTVLVVIAAVALLLVFGAFFRQSKQRAAVQADQAFFGITSRYAQGAFSEVLIAADDVLDRFGGRQEGVWTLYYAGAAHLALSENERAIERFDEYLSRDGGGIYDRSARIGKALALEASGDLEGSLPYFREVREGAGDQPDPLAVQAVIGEARVLQELGRIDEAIAALEPMLESEDPRSLEEVNARLETLRALK